VIADIEVPILFIFIGDGWKSRLLMHSLLGAVTINILLVVLVTIYLVPLVLKYLDRKAKNKRVFFFAGTDLRTHKSSTLVIVSSGLIGTISHLFFDALHHPYNPITFPFEKYYSFNLILFNNHQLANAFVGLITVIPFILMIYFWYVRDIIKK
jgi:hypothetical protein